MTDLSGAPETGNESIRDSLMAAFDEPAGNDPGTTPIPELDTPPGSDPAPAPIIDAAGRVHDPATGKFATKTQEPAPAAPDKPSDLGKIASQEPAPPAIVAPQSWSAPAKAMFASLPPEIQQEVLKREGDFNKGIEAKSLEAKRFEPLEQIIGPRREVWSRQFGSPEKGLETLVGIAENASKDPHGFIRWFAQNNSIDLSQLAQQIASQPAEDPRIAALARQVDQLSGVLTSQQQAQQQQQLASLASVVDAFAADPKNEHFQSVAPDVLGLIPQVRQAKPHATPQEVLQEAYERTIWATPGIRTQLIAREAEARALQQKQNSQAQADKSRAAALSLTGAPPTGAAVSGAAPAETLRAELEQQFSGRL